MAAGVTLKHKRKAGAFVGGELAAGEWGLDTANNAWYYSLNGTTVSTLSSGGGVAGRTTVTVDFGSVGSGFESVVVTGIAWANAAINYIINPIAHADHSVEEAVAEQMQCHVGNIVDGDGFTVFVTTPGISKGQYSFEIVGV